MGGDPPNAGLEVKMRSSLQDMDKLILDENRFVAGDDITIADFAMIASVTFVEVIDYGLEDYPNICRWLQHCKRLPFFDECNLGLYQWRDIVRSSRQSSK